MIQNSEQKFHSLKNCPEDEASRLTRLNCSHIPTKVREGKLKISNSFLKVDKRDNSVKNHWAITQI
jgi:hypothetical protein